LQNLEGQRGGARREIEYAHRHFLRIGPYCPTV